MSALHARPYEPGDADAWDRHVLASRCPHPMFLRGWVEYHADRFTDASLVIEDTDKPGHVVAVLPASAHGPQVRSHGGLTFGGLLTTRKVGAARMVDVLASVRATYRELGFEQLRYKAAPHVFHTEPAQEDLYALSRAGAQLAQREAASVVDLTAPLRYGKGRSWSLKHADAGVVLRYGDEWDTFIELERRVLARRGAEPVHTGAELRLLAAHTSGALRLLGAWDGEELLGGVVTIELPLAAHTQYIGGSQAGRERGVVDRLIDHLLREHAAAGRRWFSLGASTLDGGQVLNEGLVAQKESFGARAYVFDQYELAV